jgi:dihydropyrimidine dehydrogenase (NAD+) subunit PreA
MDKKRLATYFGGLSFQNPFILAASPSTDSREMLARGLEAGWAGAVLKTTSVASEEVSIAYPIMTSIRDGNRMVGLHNIDLISERHIEDVAEDVVWLKRHFPSHRLAVSIMASTKRDWTTLVKITEQSGADLIEVSISCPQGSLLEEVGHSQGSMISHDPALSELVTRWVKEASARIPVYVKLTSQVTDLAAIARAVEKGGADGICAIDSLEAIAGVDSKTLEPLPSVRGNTTHGGYTGRAIKPVALRCVADIARAVRIPISGVGGIYSWRDALEFLLLGATTVQVCTAVMHQGFDLVRDLSDGLSRWLETHEYANCGEIVGLALPRITEHDRLEHGFKVISRVDQSLCVKCGLCYVACRDGGHDAIIWPDSRLPIVDETKCVGCGLCEQVCPVPGCISIVPGWSFQDLPSS